MLEMDSSAAFNLVQQGVPTTHVYIAIIRAIQRLINDDWNVELCLIYCEVNRYVDRLARVGHRLPMGMSFFDSLPPLISLDFLADAYDTYCPWMIRLQFVVVWASTSQLIKIVIIKYGCRQKQWSSSHGGGWWRGRDWGG